MSLYLVKDGKKEKINISATDVQLLDIDNKYKSNNLEDAMKEIGSGTVENMNKIEGMVNKNTGDIAQLSNPNLLINGDFQVWQRGDTMNYSDNNANIYTADRWRMMQSEGGNSCTIRKNTEANCLTITGFNKKANVEMALSQKIGVPFDKKYTKDYTVSVMYSSDLNAELQIRDASDVSNPIILEKVSMPVSADIGIVSMSFPTSKLKTNSLLQVYVSFYGEDYVDKTINLFYIKLETGNLASANAPKPYAEEFNMCQRYYQVHTIGGVANTTNCLGVCSRFPTIMRVKPTVSYLADDKSIHEHGKGGVGTTDDIQEITTKEDRVDYVSLKTELFTIGKEYNLTVALDSEIY